MLKFERAIILTIALATGVSLGLAISNAVHAVEASSFTERWSPANSLFWKFNIPARLQEIHTGKSDRGPCVDRVPRCKLT